MFQPRGRSGSKLTIVYDADGREIEVQRSLVTLKSDASSGNSGGSSSRCCCCCGGSSRGRNSGISGGDAR